MRTDADEKGYVVASKSRVLTQVSKDADGNAEPLDRHQTSGNWPKIASSELVVLHDPGSVSAEAIRGVRAQLEQRALRQGSRSFAIVADGAGRGATFLAANLAVIFAQGGHKTALIDSNLSAPRLAALFDIDDSIPGLSDWLGNLDNPTHRLRYGATPLPNLSVLPAGAASHSSMLLNRNMGLIMAELNRMFDVVIYDAPQAGEQAAAMAVAAGADQTILVGREHVSKAMALSRLETLVTDCGGKVAGVVLSKF